MSAQKDEGNVMDFFKERIDDLQIRYDNYDREAKCLARKLSNGSKKCPEIRARRLNDIQSRLMPQTEEVLDKLRSQTGVMP